MKRLYTLIALVLMSSVCAMAQVSIDEVKPTEEKAEFSNDIKTKTLDAEYDSEAVRRAERLAIRKERNTVDFLNVVPAETLIELLEQLQTEAESSRSNPDYANLVEKLDAAGVPGKISNREELEQEVKEVAEGLEDEETMQAWQKILECVE